MLEQVVRLELDAEPAQLALEDLPALGDVLVALLAAEPLPDLLPGRGGRDVSG